MSLLFEKREHEPELATDHSELEQVFNDKGLTGPSKIAFNMYPMILLELIDLCLKNPANHELYKQIAEQCIEMLNGLCKRNEEIELSADDLMRTCFTNTAKKGQLNVQIKQLSEDKAQLEVSSTQKRAEINNLTSLMI